MTRTLRLLVLLAALLAGLTAAAPASSQAAPEGIDAYGPLTAVVDVAAGDRFGCARTQDRHVLCWGSNESGRLGSGVVDTDLRPAERVDNVAGTGPLSTVIDVAAGSDHACAVLANHQVRCWGQGTAGQLGNGGFDNSVRPVPVLAVSGTGRLDDVADVTVDGAVSCARLLDGQVRCWGIDNFGQLGNGTASGNRSRPVVVRAPTGNGPLTQVTQIDASQYTVCAALAAGQARCWGGNEDGQLGDGTTTPRFRPVVVSKASGAGALTGVRRISAGYHHSCAVLSDGTVRCWGDNDYGQLGDGSFDPHHRPKPVTNAAGSGPLRGVDDLAAGLVHTCALLTNRQVRCWGDNEYDEIGYGVENGEYVPRPTAVRNRAGTANLAGVAALHTSGQHTCVALQNAEARCWGYGQGGGLGDLDLVDRSLPVPVYTAAVLLAVP